MEGLKTCSKCGESKPLDGFYKRARNVGGHEAHCKACAYIKQRRWYLANRDKTREYGRLWRERNPGRMESLRRVQKYGITSEEWDVIFEGQGKRCAICGTDEPGPKRWQTDHCHKSGKVRGILCHRCNMGIGLMRDCPDILLSAHAYVVEHLPVEA